MATRLLTDCLVLRIWEEGAAQHALDRALTLLSHACPELDRYAHAALPIGRRDAQLLSLHEAEFGPQVEGTSVCPECGQRASFNLSIPEIRVRESGTGHAGVLSSGPYRIVFRLPDSFDLAAAAATREVERAKSTLIGRCVVEAECSGVSISAPELPVSLTEALAAAMANADAQGDVECRFECLECRFEWTGIFDIALFIWEKVANRARRVIGEIHALAEAYGWSEAAILEMSAARRGLYLQRVGDV